MKLHFKFQRLQYSRCILLLFKSVVLPESFCCCSRECFSHNKRVHHRILIISHWDITPTSVHVCSQLSSCEYVIVNIFFKWLCGTVCAVRCGYTHMHPTCHSAVHLVDLNGHDIMSIQDKVIISVSAVKLYLAQVSTYQIMLVFLRWQGCCCAAYCFESSQLTLF